MALPINFCSDQTHKKSGFYNVNNVIRCRECDGILLPSRRMFAKEDTVPDKVRFEPLILYRSWYVTIDWKWNDIARASDWTMVPARRITFFSINAHLPWAWKEMVAQCEQSARYMNPHVSPAPNWDCTCGLYGFGDDRQLGSRVKLQNFPLRGRDSGSVVIEGMFAGIFVGYGKTILHRKGARTQYGDILAVAGLDPRVCHVLDEYFRRFHIDIRVVFVPQDLEPLGRRYLDEHRRAGGGDFHPEAYGSSERTTYRDHPYDFPF